jgi:membrane-associated phospholipid phosphatase
MTASRVIEQAAQAEHRLLEPVLELNGSTLVRALTPLAKAADEPPLIALSLATLATGAVLRHPRTLRTGARMFAAHLVANGLKTVLKGAVDRRRPNAVEDGPEIKPGSGTDDKAANAFPSGHTAGALAVAQAVAHEVPRLAAPARVVAVIAGGMQVPRGAHYASDVLSGAIVGWVSERIAGVVLDRGEQAVRRYVLR